MLFPILHFHLEQYTLYAVSGFTYGISHLTSSGFKSLWQPRFGFKDVLLVFFILVLKNFFDSTAVEVN